MYIYIYLITITKKRKRKGRRRKCETKLVSQRDKWPRKTKHYTNVTTTRDFTKKIRINQKSKNKSGEAQNNTTSNQKMGNI